MKNEYAKQTIGTKKSLILKKLKLNIILSKTALLLGFSQKTRMNTILNTIRNTVMNAIMNSLLNTKQNE